MRYSEPARGHVWKIARVERTAVTWPRTVGGTELGHGCGRGCTNRPVSLHRQLPLSCTEEVYGCWCCWRCVRKAPKITEAFSTDRCSTLLRHDRLFNWTKPSDTCDRPTLMSELLVLSLTCETCSSLLQHVMTFFSCRRLVTTRTFDVVFPVFFLNSAHRFFHSGVTPWLVSPGTVRPPFLVTPLSVIQEIQAKLYKTSSYKKLLDKSVRLQ